MRECKEGQTEETVCQEDSVDVVVDQECRGFAVLVLKIVQLPQRHLSILEADKIRHRALSTTQWLKPLIPPCQSQRQTDVF